MAIFVIIVALGVALIQGRGMAIASSEQSACQHAAVSCYDDQMIEVTKYLTTDIEEVCMSYLSMNDCLERVVAGRSCTDDTTAVSDVQRDRRAEMSGLCKPDYSLTSCGDDLNKCLQSYETDVATESSSDKSDYKLTCQDIDSVQACIKAMLESERCSEQSTFITQRIYAMMATQSLLQSCDDDCGPVYGGCLQNVVGTLGIDMATTDWTDFCTNAGALQTCLQQNNKDGNCDKQSQMPGILQKYFSDYCDNTSIPNECVGQLHGCSHAYKTVYGETDVSLQCQAINSYLECSNSLFCKAGLKQVIDRRKTALLELAKQKNCATLIPQPGATDPTFAPPQTDCGKKALGCYNQQNGIISNQLQALNFSQACAAYKNQAECFRILAIDRLCHKGENSELTNIRKQAANVVKSLCGDDGSISSCSRQLIACKVQLTNVKNDFKNNDAQSACPAITSFESCARILTASGTCDEKINAILDQSLVNLNKDELLEGCDGPCGTEVGKCTKDIQFALTKPLTEIDWTTYCQSFSTVFKCVQDLETNSACKDQKDMVTKAVNSLQSYSSDFCDSQGKPTECNVQVQKCSHDFKGVANRNVKAECQATANFLECTSGIACYGRLGSFTDSERLFLENQERTNKCPTVGSCLERLEVCGKQEEDYVTLNNGEHKDEQCALIRSGLDCYQVQKADIQCSDMVDKITSAINSLNTNLKEKCAGTSIQVSVILIVMSVMAALRNLLN